MKRVTSFAIALLIMLSTAIFGQASDKPYASAFTSAAADSVQFDVDIKDSIAMDTTLFHSVIYRDPSTTSWNKTDMNELYTACSLYTFSATVEYSTSTDSLEWYFSSEGDSVIATQSPKNVGDVFPVPAYLQADLGEDPVGDVDGGGSHLDIVHAYASYSDQKLYVRIDNAGGGFPTSSGFDFYLYSVGIVDPDVEDSIAFSFIYVNVPFVMSPGLYRFDPVDSSLTNIGSVSTDISGNSLSMSCNISDLTSQPEWSDWPPPSGYIILAPITSTQNLSSELVTNDWGKIAAFIPESQMTDYSVNSAPVLSGAGASDDGNGAILAQVTFTDPDNNTAVWRHAYIDNTLHDMTACEKDYLNGTLFEATVEVDSTGWYDYYYEFSDGVEIVTTDIDSVYVEVPTYVPGDADGSGAVDIDDVVYLIQYIFSGGPAPDPLESGDADCSGLIDIDDVVYLIQYIFNSGPPPC